MTLSEELSLNPEASLWIRYCGIDLGVSSRAEYAGDNNRLYSRYSDNLHSEVHFRRWTDGVVQMPKYINGNYVTHVNCIDAHGVMMVPLH